MAAYTLPARVILGVLAVLVVVASTVLLVGLRTPAQAADAPAQAATTGSRVLAPTSWTAGAPVTTGVATSPSSAPIAATAAAPAQSTPVTLTPDAAPSAPAGPSGPTALPANDPNAHDGKLGVARIGGVTVQTLAPNAQTTSRNVPIASAQELATLPVAPGTPKAATRYSKSRNVPLLPPDGQHGKRAVYSKAYMTVWLVDGQDHLVARYPVVGRFDRPAPGVYHVFSKSPVAYNPNSKVTFKHMARFTYGPDTRSPIGFHEIPVYANGRPMHSTSSLGLAIARGGCVRLAPDAAAAVYSFLKVGDKVVVLPSA